MAELAHWTSGSQRVVRGTISQGFGGEGSVTYNLNFDVLLTMHLSIFISVFNQLDAQNLFHNKFYFMPLHVSSTCVHHQEVKITIHSSSSGSQNCITQSLVSSQL